MVVRSGRLSRWVVAAVALAIGLAGCGGSSSSNNNGNNGGNDGGNNPPPVLKRTVTGFVGDATTGRGISSATITVGTLTTTTGADGLFTLPSVPRQDSTISFQAQGYVTQQQTLGASTDQVTVRLIPAGVGPVENPPGTPGV